MDPAPASTSTITNKDLWNQYWELEQYLSPTRKKGESFCSYIKKVYETYYERLNSFVWDLRQTRKWVWRNDAYIKKHVVYSLGDNQVAIEQRLNSRDLLVRSLMIKSQHARIPEAVIAINEVKSAAHYILPDLYLGGIEVLDKHEFLTNHVKRVLSVINLDEDQRPKPPILHRMSPISDAEQQPLVELINEEFPFIEAGREEGGVVVHCMGGSSRSAAVVIGYLMKKYLVGYEIASGFVKTIRPEVKPNDAFVAQLNEFERRILIQFRTTV